MTEPMRNAPAGAPDTGVLSQLGGRRPRAREGCSRSANQAFGRKVAKKGYFCGHKRNYGWRKGVILDKNKREAVYPVNFGQKKVSPV